MQHKLNSRLVQSFAKHFSEIIKYVDNIVANLALTIQTTIVVADRASSVFCADINSETK